MDNRAKTSPENARHATGPRTEQGKRHSSLNALKHGAYSRKTTILPGEDPRAFEELARWHAATYRPRGPVEASLLHQMTNALWRLERLGPAETSLVSIQMQRMEILFDAEDIPEDPQHRFAVALSELAKQNEGVTHITREERRLLRQYGNLKAELLDLQQRRPPLAPPEPVRDSPQDEETEAPETPNHENAETNLTPPTGVKVTNPYAAIYRSFPPLPKIKKPLSKEARN
jgi:hypothetical protein